MQKPIGNCPKQRVTACAVVTKTCRLDAQDYSPEGFPGGLFHYLLIARLLVAYQVNRPWF